MLLDHKNTVVTNKSVSLALDKALDKKVSDIQKKYYDLLEKVNEN